MEEKENIFGCFFQVGFGLLFYQYGAFGHRHFVTIRTNPAPALSIRLHFYDLDHFALTICKDVK